MPLLNHKPKQGPDPKPEPGADRKRTGYATVTLLKSFISGFKKFLKTALVQKIKSNGRALSCRIV